MPKTVWINFVCAASLLACSENGWAQTNGHSNSANVENSMPSVSDSEERKVESGAEAFRQARYADTVALLTPAARHGNARAQFILALVFQVGGIGVNKDFEKSKMWYRKSAKNGDADAQFRLYKICRSRICKCDCRLGLVL